MRQIVDERIWKDQAIARGEEAVFDRDLYQRVHRHLWELFKKFCEERRLPGFPPTPATGGTFDADAYARQTSRFQSAFQRFLREKPSVLVLDDRFFVLTYLAELAFRVDELTAQEVADALNSELRRKGIVNRIKGWFRPRPVWMRS